MASAAKDIPIGTMALGSFFGTSTVGVEFTSHHKVGAVDCQSEVRF
jgi:hypothetical protein